MSFSLDETTDVGRDTGAPVTPDYPVGDNAFTGTGNWVRLDLGDDSHDHSSTELSAWAGSRYPRATTASTPTSWPLRPDGRIDHADVRIGDSLVMLSQVSEQSWGDRVCGFVDPFDNRWWVATHLREFS